MELRQLKLLVRSMKIEKFLKKEYLFLLLIIILGSYIRLAGIANNTFAYTYDVGRDLLAVSNILTTHKISLIGPTTGLEGVFYGPWWYLIILPFFVLSRGDPQWITGLMAFLGIAAIPLIYYLGKKIGGVFTATALALTLAVCQPISTLTGQIWSPNISPPFIVITFIILYKIYSDKKPNYWNYFWLGLVTTLIQEMGIVFGVIFLSGIILSLVVNIRNKFRIKDIPSFLLGVFVILSPRILFEFRHNFLMSKAFLHFLSAGEPGQNVSIFIRGADRFNLLLNDFNYTFGFSSVLWTALFIIIIILALVLYYKKADLILKKMINSFLSVIAVFFIALTLFRHEIWPHYLVSLPIVFILLFIFSLGLIAKNIKNYILPSIIILILVILNVNFVGIIDNFTNTAPKLKDIAVYANQVEVLDYVYSQSAGRNFKYVVYTPPVHDYTYRYLFQWYGPYKYHYLPSDKASLAFFILEPDKSNPKRLSDWLKSRENDGNIIKSKTFYSGIIVQTRITK